MKRYNVRFEDCSELSVPKLPETFPVASATFLEETQVEFRTLEPVTPSIQKNSYFFLLTVQNFAVNEKI